MNVQTIHNEVYK